MIPRVFIGLPSHEFVSPIFVQALMQFTHEAPFHIALKWNVGDGISRARNVLTADFLESDCTHLLFLDTDLIFSAAHVERLLSHRRPLVAGFYSKKWDGPLEWVCNVMDRDQPAARPDGLQEVKYIGTGFMLIERAVFEKMGQALDIWYRQDGSGRIEWDFWPIAIHTFPDGSRRYLSEDWNFCQRWRDLGGSVFGDTRVILRHIGQAIYPLQSQAPQPSDVPASAPSAA